MAYHHLLLAPEQIRLVHRVYNLIIREQWFPRTRHNCDECARLVLQLYQGGIDEEIDLLEETRAAAQNRFGRSPTIGSPFGRQQIQATNGDSRRAL